MNDPNFEFIAKNALLFGTTYALVGASIGWIPLKFITQDRWLKCVWLSIFTQLFSTMFAFYFFPLTAYALFRTNTSWQIAGAISIFTGLPSLLSDLLILRVTERVKFSGKLLLILGLWRVGTFMICLVVALMIPAIYTLSNWGPAK